MESSAVAVLARTAECAALLFIGYKLRSAQLFSATDAEVSQRLEGAAELSFSIIESPFKYHGLLCRPLSALLAT